MSLPFFLPKIGTARLSAHCPSGHDANSGVSDYVDERRVGAYEPLS